MAPSSNRGPGRGSPRSRGTTRPRTAPAASSAPLAPARSARFTTRALVLLAVVLLLVASYASSLNAWWQQRQEIQTTKAEIATKKEQIGRLEDAQDRWEDPAYIEQQARRRFGWVMPGEVGYRVIGADGQVQGDVASLDEKPAATQRSWQDRLWSSVEQAGQNPRETAQDTAPAPDPDKVLKNKS